VINSKKYRIVFLTGTRADFGKIKALVAKLTESHTFEVFLFVTGMHMMARYGSTWVEVQSSQLGQVYTFINQNQDDSMEVVFAKTVSGFSDYVREVKPDMVVVHGDRIEALAGATVGALAGVRVAHIEGGEISGTVDELIRHAVTKLSHLHFVSNEEARGRVVQLGEDSEHIFVIGSPDIDIMNSQSLPTLEQVMNYYQFDFTDYGILMFHPVTTELERLQVDARTIVDFVLDTGLNFVVILPNNDLGSHLILDEYARFAGFPRIRVFPSMRFEYFLTTLNSARFILGNSSAGVREAPHFGVPAINVGTRQFRRSTSDRVINCEITRQALFDGLNAALAMERVPEHRFGSGNSAEQFLNRLREEKLWRVPIQKTFNDLD